MAQVQAKATQAKLVQTEDGYCQVHPKRIKAELVAHYNTMFYGRDSGKNNYNYGYTQEELEHKYLAAEEALHFAPKKQGTLFEVGFGEGFVLDFFHKKGWDVTGIDFTADGI